jgi:orotate phosphoribosyltransferase
LAEENFKNQKVTLHTLTNYLNLLQLALETGYIKEEQLEILKQWRQNPDKWMQE